MKYKLWIILAFIFSLIIFIIIGTFNYKIDSLGLLRETTLDKVAEELSNGKIIAGLGNIDERIFRKKQIEYLKNNGVNVYFYLTPYNPITYDILVSKEKYKIIDEVEIYVKEFAKQNNIKVVGSYDPHKLNLKNEHFFDGMHSLDIAYEIIFKDLFK